jgi:hypothetical protein
MNIEVRAPVIGLVVVATITGSLGFGDRLFGHFRVEQPVTEPPRSIPWQVIKARFQTPMSYEQAVRKVEDSADPVQRRAGPAFPSLAKFRHFYPTGNLLVQFEPTTGVTAVVAYGEQDPIDLLFDVWQSSTTSERGTVIDLTPKKESSLIVAEPVGRSFRLSVSMMATLLHATAPPTFEQADDLKRVDLSAQCSEKSAREALGSSNISRFALNQPAAFPMSVRTFFATDSLTKLTLSYDPIKANAHLFGYSDDGQYVLAVQNRLSASQRTAGILAITPKSSLVEYEISNKALAASFNEVWPRLREDFVAWAGVSKSDAEFPKWAVGDRGNSGNRCTLGGATSFGDSIKSTSTW